MKLKNKGDGLNRLLIVDAHQNSGVQRKKFSIHAGTKSLPMTSEDGKLLLVFKDVLDF